jgi:hypothetical protein
MRTRFGDGLEDKTVSMLTFSLLLAVFEEKLGFVSQ